MYVFVIGTNAAASAVAQALYKVCDVTPPRVRRWACHLCHLSHGGAYEQIAAAMERQRFTLFYGYPWSHPACETFMRVQFPDAIWIQADVELEGKLTPLCCEPADCTFATVGAAPPEAAEHAYVAFAEAVSRLPPRMFEPAWSFPCQCSRLRLVNANSWMATQAAQTQSVNFRDTCCFTVEPSGTDTDLRIYQDFEFRRADALHRERNIAWHIEPDCVSAGCEADVRAHAPLSCSRVYMHSDAVPCGARWIPDADIQISVPKLPLASIVMSMKTYAPGHALRHQVKAAFREDARLRCFGSGGDGVKLGTKTPATQPYMYHVVIENDRVKGLWTEKLIDALVCKCVVLYWGAPDVFEWFNPGSIIPFDSTEDLLGCLNEMSTDDYAARAASIEQNWHRAQARVSYFDNLALDTDVLSVPHGNVLACSNTMQAAK